MFDAFACQYRGMSRSARAPVSVAVAILLMVSIAGCTATDVGADPSPSAQNSAPPTTSTPSSASTEEDQSTESASGTAQWKAAIAAFPYELPDGYAFAPEPPRSGFAGASSLGADVAYHWWGCATLLSAWAAVDDGDQDGANQLLAQLNQAKTENASYFRGWDEPGPIRWEDPMFREGGDSGLCATWFDTIGNTGN